MPQLRLDPHELHDHLAQVVGPVIDAHDLSAYCARFGLCRRTVTRSLQQLLLENEIERPRRNLWFLPHASTTQEDRRIARAAVGCRSSGRWAHVAGAWALQLHGLVGNRTPALHLGMRFCHCTKAALMPSHSADGACRSQHALFHGATPRLVLGRHVTVLDEHLPIASVTVMPDHLGRVVALTSSDGTVAHALAPADAAVSMFSSVRLSGGFDPAFATFSDAVDQLERSQLRAAILRARLATRRRVAFALRAIAYADDDGRTLRDRSDVERFCQIARGGGSTLLDPHRLEGGLRCRFTAVYDNRAMPLRPAAVLEARSLRSPDPEAYHPSMEL